MTPLSVNVDQKTLVYPELKSMAEMLEIQNDL